MILNASEFHFSLLHVQIHHIFKFALITVGAEAIWQNLLAPPNPDFLKHENQSFTRDRVHVTDEIFAALCFAVYAYLLIDYFGSYFLVVQGMYNLPPLKLDLLDNRDIGMVCVGDHCNADFISLFGSKNVDRSG